MRHRFPVSLWFYLQATIWSQISGVGNVTSQLCSCPLCQRILCVICPHSVSSPFPPSHVHLGWGFVPALICTELFLILSNALPLSMVHYVLNATCCAVSEQPSPIFLRCSLCDHLSAWMIRCCALTEEHVVLFRSPERFILRIIK